jgi:hypothetical protein
MNQVITPTFCRSVAVKKPSMHEFEALTRDAGRVQFDTLKRILELNADAEYLKHCHPFVCAQRS